MDIRQLEYFLALVKQENISTTADLFDITQSALSKSIANLEKEVGVRLFDHHGNRIELNDYGRNFSVYAAKAIETIESGLFSTRQTMYDICGSISITCHAFSGILEEVVSDYHFLNPNVQVVIHRHSNRGAKENVEDYDFILCSSSAVSFLEKSESRVPMELFQEEVVLLISEKYKKFPPECTALPLESLRNEAFIGMRDSSQLFQDATFRLCTAAGFMPRVAFETNDYLFKVRLVGTGRAIAFVPECCVDTAHRLYPDIRSYHILNTDTRRSVFLMRKRRALMSEAAQDFWNFTIEHFHCKPDTQS